MPSISKEEIEKIIIDLREKTELDWKHFDRPQMEGPPAPCIFLKIELSAQSRSGGVVDPQSKLAFNQKRAEEYEGIKKNYEQQLQAQLGINPDDVRLSVMHSRTDLNKIVVTIEINDINVMKKIAMQQALSSEQSSDSFKNVVRSVPGEMRQIL